MRATLLVRGMLTAAASAQNLHRVSALDYRPSGEHTVERSSSETRVFAGPSGSQTARPADPPRPVDFVRLRSVVPGIRVELRYFSNDNFTGRPIDGYEAEIVYLTRPAALALRSVQQALTTRGLALKVFDGYRPQHRWDRSATRRSSG